MQNKMSLHQKLLEEGYRVRRVISRKGTPCESNPYAVFGNEIEGKMVDVALVQAELAPDSLDEVQKKKLYDLCIEYIRPVK